MARRYVHGPGVDEPLVWYEGSGTGDRRWLHADERGSMIAVSDGSGNIVARVNRYDEYGIAAGDADRAVRLYRAGVAPRARHVVLPGADVQSGARAGSCRPIRSGTRTGSISTPMSGTIRSTSRIRPFWRDGLRCG